MNKNKIISDFSAYAQSYDLGNQQVAQKFQHAMNVANYCLDIANFLLLDENLKTVAFLSGLLHEYGAFEAIKKQAHNVAHKNTMQFLFKENQIDFYTQNKSQVSLIKKTLQAFFNTHKNKTAAAKPEELLGAKTQAEKVLLLVSILKDADTLELFGMYKRKTQPPFKNPSFKKKSLSSDVLKQFKQGQQISLDIVKSNLDYVLSVVSMFFGLNYFISKNIALKIEFDKGIQQSYLPHLQETEANKLEKVLLSFRKTFYPENN